MTTKALTPITKKQQDHLYNVLTTCHSIGIQSVIIEPELVRAASEDRRVLLLNDIDDKDTQIATTIAIGHVGSLLSRMNVIDGVMDTVYEDKVDQDGSSRAVRLQSTSGKFQVSFRCSLPQLIKAPKTIKDTDIKLVIPATTELKDVISRGIKAMAAETFSLIYDSAAKVVKVLIRDGNDEQLVIDLDIKPVDDNCESFEHLYAKDLIGIIQKLEGSLEITSRGMLKGKLNDLSIALVPYVSH